MGTNYYWLSPVEQDTCAHCGRGDPREQLHIGKSSVGWCFALHVIPQRGINTLEDWKRLFNQPGSAIEDEYGHRYDPAFMMRIITERRLEVKPFEGWSARQLAENLAVLGPNGLARHATINARAGEGTWDYLTGEFS
jgi:hypothetical protein